MNIAFFVGAFTERGTEVALFTYAKYNEEFLHNKSIIVYPRNITEKDTFEKFKQRFEMIEIEKIEDMKELIPSRGIHVFYVITHGGPWDNRHGMKEDIWGNCVTLVHCVFDTTNPQGDHYLAISDTLNKKYNTHVPVIPHIVERSSTTHHLREKLGLGNAIVFGRYGGYDQFDNPIAHTAIREYLSTDPNAYFLFMNTKPFYHHPRILYLEKSIHIEDKERFVNTCDAMIHARNLGETFGLSIAEFSIQNKPIITFRTQMDNAHLDILGKKAVLYHSVESLVEIFENLPEIIPLNDWTAYDQFTPEKVMPLFVPLFTRKEKRN